jgi:hypothetical protein
MAVDIEGVAVEINSFWSGSDLKWRKKSLARVAHG